MVKVKAPVGRLKKKSKTLKVTKKKLQKLPKKIEPDSDSELEELLQESDQEEAENSNEESNESEVDEQAIEENHQNDLEKLKRTDPEFYKFLQENDKKLLQFSVSDDEGADSDEEPEEELHKPSDNGLEVASDESDFEDEELTDKKVVTLKLLKIWQAEIQTDKSNKTIIKIAQAFHAALNRISANDNDDDESVVYKVDGSAVFNGVIQLCVMHFGPSVRRFLGLQSGSKIPPHKCKKFKKIKTTLKSYFADLLKLLMNVSSTNIQTVLLKHLHYMCPMLSSYSSLTKSVLTKLIRLWGTADDSVRVLAFFCILRIVNNQMQSTLDMCLKSMYMTYVKNSKFVSTTSLAGINFMKRSLVEMFSLDLNVAYSHVFLYIRQLAIHLRNAITANKTENLQAVYNWQFVNSLRLWGMLLGLTHGRAQMQQLVYPFVQICLGTIKLVPTAQYYPLRFHVVQILIDFTKDSGVYIPILPFILEVLTQCDFNKKHQKVSMKPQNFTCILRLSKSQLLENGFKDTVIDTVYSLLLEYLSTMSNSISFPDLSLLCIVQIKQFIKQCKNVNYNRKLKQALDKIEQNSKFIETERSKLTLKLTDVKQIEGWESQIKTKGTPLATFYACWQKVRTIKKNKEATNNDVLGDYKLPTLKKVNRKNKVKEQGPIELFPSDSEDDAEEEEESKPRRGKRGGKNARKNKKSNNDNDEEMDVDGDDLVEDISADDW